MEERAEFGLAARPGGFGGYFGAVEEGEGVREEGDGWW